MTRPRIVALTLAVLALAPAGCSATNSTKPAAASTATSPSPSPSPTAPSGKIGVPFRNGGFEVTVTKVATNVQQLDIDEVAKSGGIKPWTPKNGQYIVVYLTAKNVGTAPTSCSVTSSTLMDSAGKTYDAAGPFIGGLPVGEGLGYDDMQPDTTASGFIAFDVPTMVTSPTTLITQTDAYVATTNPPTSVSLLG